MGLIAIIALLAGILLSLHNGNRKLPLTLLFIGLITTFGPLASMISPFGLAITAILAAVIWIDNKADMA